MICTSEKDRMATRINKKSHACVTIYGPLLAVEGN